MQELDHDESRRQSKKDFFEIKPGIRKTAPIVRCRTFDFSAVGHVVTPDEHAYSNSGMAEIHSLREKIVREDISRRLKKVCSDFSDDEFEKLVTLMATRQVRCERRQSW